MSAYARECCQYLIGQGKKPTPPLSAIGALKDVIEYIDDDEAKKTFGLVSWYQVQHARIMNRGEQKQVEIDESLYDTALLQAYVNDLFDYARNEPKIKKSKEIYRTEVEDALKSVVTIEAWVRVHDNLNGVIDIIKRRHI